jgi:outer membrane protein OmpA-like peptidoglycan-associated protein
VLTISISAVVAVLTMVSVAQGAQRPLTSSDVHSRAHAAIDVLYPTGTPDASEPSGYGPPGANAMGGYAQTYVNDFGGSSLPPTWSVFSGIPGGDPSGRWATSHVTVGGGLLQLNTFQDPKYANAWVSGGLCQCGLTRTYGAYFVRSRITGSGPTQVELLWPQNNTWPPEIDFNETFGGTVGTLATDHYDANNDQVHSKLTVDMTQWHTWGVIWSPTSIIYTVDGAIWGTVTNTAEISSMPMELDISQQTFCAATSGWACPTAPESLDVDWVDEYAPSSSSPTTTTIAASSVASASLHVGPFRSGSATVRGTALAQIGRLARKIKSGHDTHVKLVGYGDVRKSGAPANGIGLARATSVKRTLERTLRSMGVAGVIVAVRGRSGRAVTTPLAKPVVVLHAVVIASIS